MDRVGDITCGVIFGLGLVVIAVVLLPALLSPGLSVKSIEAACRKHGGVAQFVPEAIRIGGREPATVICRDGKVGRP